jgi:hypothetical protein
LQSFFLRHEQPEQLPADEDPETEVPI